MLLEKDCNDCNVLKSSNVIILLHANHLKCVIQFKVIIQNSWCTFFNYQRLPNVPLDAVEVRLKWSTISGVGHQLIGFCFTWSIRVPLFWLFVRSELFLTAWFEFESFKMAKVGFFVSDSFVIITIFLFKNHANWWHQGVLSKIKSEFHNLNATWIWLPLGF